MIKIGEYVSEKELIENIVYPDRMYRKQIEELKQQLQAYKEKEDKLREYCNSKEFEYHFESEANMKSCHRKILQILNEGDK